MRGMFASLCVRGSVWPRKGRAVLYVRWLHKHLCCQPTAESSPVFCSCQIRGESAGGVAGFGTDGWTCQVSCLFSSYLEFPLRYDEALHIFSVLTMSPSPSVSSSYIIAVMMYCSLRWLLDLHNDFLFSALVGRCPFCDFRALMAPDDKVFRCSNPLCEKVSPNLVSI